MIIYGSERTTSLDGDYDEPNYFKTLSDAYYFLTNSYKVKKYFNDKELDKNYDDYGYSCGNKSKIPTGNYYLLSIEKTEELYLDLQTDFKNVYKTPDDGIIYYAQILKSNMNVICDEINLSNTKNSIQLSYFGLYKVSQDIQINNISTSIDYIDHMYPGKINIRLLIDLKMLKTIYLTKYWKWLAFEWHQTEWNKAIIKVTWLKQFFSSAKYKSKLSNKFDSDTGGSVVFNVASLLITIAIRSYIGIQYDSFKEW